MFIVKRNGELSEKKNCMINQAFDLVPVIDINKINSNSDKIKISKQQTFGFIYKKS